MPLGEFLFSKGIEPTSLGSESRQQKFAEEDGPWLAGSGGRVWDDLESRPRPDCYQISG